MFIARSLVKYVEKNCQQKVKRHWAFGKPKLDNARKMGGIYHIHPEDVEFKDTMKNARRKLEMQLESAILCKLATSLVRPVAK